MIVGRIAGRTMRAPDPGLGGAVDPGRLEELAGHAVQGGQEHDEGPADALPDPDEPDHRVAGPGLRQPVDVHLVARRKARATAFATPPWALKMYAKT